MVLFLGGVQLITIGILGEYIARIYEQSKRRPLFLIKEMVNIQPPAKNGKVIDEWCYK
jgi:glycosyltransferase involved in cell wall biosynthesis